MKAVVHAYAEVMKLIRHLPPRTRSYYSQFARENFVTYSQEKDPSVIRSLLLRAHHHSCWVLRKVIRLGPIKHTNLTPSRFFSLFLAFSASCLSLIFFVSAFLFPSSVGATLYLQVECEGIDSSTALFVLPDQLTDFWPLEKLCSEIRSVK